MDAAKVEIISQHIIMRSNVEVIGGKLTFPSEKIEHPLDIHKVKSVGGTEDGCFVFYNKNYQVIARGSIRNDWVENELRLEWKDEDRTADNYPDEVMQIWLDWLFGNTAIDKVWALLDGNFPEKDVLVHYFKEEHAPNSRENIGKGSKCYSLCKEDWHGIASNPQK